MSLYRYAANLVRVVDGDTLVLDLDLGLRVWARNLHVRLLGINCPELPTAAGIAATEATISWLVPLGIISTLHVETAKDKADKYGRWLVTVHRDSTFTGETLNEWLVATGHAVPYLV